MLLHQGWRLLVPFFSWVWADIYGVFVDPTREPWPFLVSSEHRH